MDRVGATAGEYWNPELDTMPWQQVQRWQRQQLSENLPRIAAASELYAEKLAGFGGRLGEVALAELPFTGKDELRRGQEDSGPGRPLGRQQAAEGPAVVQLVSSSGTSGRPVLYGLTRRDRQAWADGMGNLFFTAGIRDRDVVAHLTALPMVAGGLPFADAIREVGATLAWMGGFPLERVLRTMPLIGVTCLSATTSFCRYLTDRCEELSGMAPRELGVRSLLGGGESGLGESSTREHLREAWGLEAVREIMGLSDVMAAMWAECEEERGMHFCAGAHVAVELIDPATGEPREWAEGASGEPVYTTFDREATPLVRFRSGDNVVVEGVDCACGRTAPRIRCVGRTDDMLIYKGMNVFPSAIRDVVAGSGIELATPYVRVCKQSADQVRFDEPIPVEVEASAPVAAEAAAPVERRLVQEIREQLQVRTEVRLIEPGSMPRTGYKTALVHVRDGGDG